MIKRVLFWTFILCYGFTFHTANAQKTLRVMSYNIHNGVGMDHQADYERVAEVINRYAPDIVAIQEADSVTRRSSGVDVLHCLADYTLMHRLYAPSIDYEGGKYGIGLLSKEKPLRQRVLALPRREEERVLLVAEFPGYICACTHFSLTPQDQIASLALITEAVQQTDKPVLLLGDLNSTPESSVFAALKEKFVPLSDVKKKTYPADEPQKCLDYVLGYTGNGTTYTVLGSWVIEDTVASDHRPVLVDLRLKTPADRIFRTQPYLQNPVDGGITVSWLTHAPVYSWVEYGTDTVELKQARTLMNGQAVCNNYIHKVRLEQLKPGTTYYYRVCSREILSYRAYSKVFGDTAVSAFRTFTLPAEQDSDFTALIFNDVHNQHKTLDTLYERVKDMDYDFVVFNGDVFDAPAKEDDAVRSLSYYNNKVGADRVPVFYLRGNHEIRNAYSIYLPGLLDNAGGKTYSAFHWGDTRFVLLDCGEDKPDDHWVYYGLNDFSRFRQEQAEFLEKEIHSRAFRKAARRVLIHHIPVYGNVDEYKPCTDLWGKILAKAPFHVSLNAHTHRYAYHPKGSAGNNFPVFVGGGYSLKDATVMILKKEGNKMTVKVLNAKGDVLDEIEV